jgi:hypothetical protein
MNPLIESLIGRGCGSSSQDSLFQHSSFNIAAFPGGTSPLFPASRSGHRLHQSTASSHRIRI